MATLLLFDDRRELAVALDGALRGGELRVMRRGNAPEAFAVLDGGGIDTLVVNLDVDDERAIDLLEAMAAGNLAMRPKTLLTSQRRGADHPKVAAAAALCPTARFVPAAELAPALVAMGSAAAAPDVSARLSFVASEAPTELASAFVLCGIEDAPDDPDATDLAPAWVLREIDDD